MNLRAGVAEAIGAERASDDPADRVAYARDLWPRHLIDVRDGRVATHSPAAICWPESTEDVVKVVEFARHEGARIVPFGAGSGVCAGVLPDAQTIVLDVKKMNDWNIDASLPVIDVGPGATGITLEEDIQREGFTMGHFPSSILCSTVGGWIAARGAGQCSGRYGKIEDIVAELECVLGTGEVVTMKRRFDGPNLVPLVVGSEGTLGVITRAKLRLCENPSERAFSAFSFGDIRAGWDALRQLFQAGLRPAVTRLYDPLDSYFLKQKAGKSSTGKRASSKSKKRSGGGGNVMKQLRAAGLGILTRAPGMLNGAVDLVADHLLDGSILVLVFEGDGARADGERADGICRGLGAKSLGEAPARHWLAHRYSVSYRQSGVFRAGAFNDTMEVSAPWSKLGQLYDDVRHAFGAHVLVMAHLSHAYPDGCSIYFTFVGGGKTDEQARGIYDRAWRDALAAAVGAGGSLSHHHGVGRSKGAGVVRELGSSVGLLRSVMTAWDPDRILNPGAVIPADAESPSGSRARTATPFSLDETSRLATVDGRAVLGEVEKDLDRRGFHLRLGDGADRAATVARWVAAGVPGAPDRWDDPVDQMVVGLVARVGDQQVTIRPTPRRAVGPDLSTLFVGGRQDIGELEAGTFRVNATSEPTARPLKCQIERNPPLGESEKSAWESIVRKARAS